MPPEEPLLGPRPRGLPGRPAVPKQNNGQTHERPRRVLDMLPSQELKARIRAHYEKGSDYYRALWGEHIHLGYFKTDSDAKEQAQTQLIDLLLERSKLAKDSTVLDVGCGIGGTSRYLARNWNCRVTGVTLGGREIEIAKHFAATAGKWLSPKDGHDTDYFELGSAGGEVRFVELDAETMIDYFGFGAEPVTFNCVWIVEALSHLPDKKLFFGTAEMLLEVGGKLIIADVFRADASSEERVKEDGIVLPPFLTQSECMQLAKQANFKVLAEPQDISEQVAKSWDIALSLLEHPVFKSFASVHGKDASAFLQAFSAMRKGYETGSLRYSTMVFEKTSQSF